VPVTVKVTGGDKAAEALAEIDRRLDGKHALNVGFLAGNFYEETGESVAMVAAIQNFGAPARGIPPRPFFTNMVNKESPGWGAALGAALKACDYDAERALALMGEVISGQLQQSIVDTNDPPLAPSTLRSRGVDPGTKYNPSDAATFGAKPLIRTGKMRNSVAYEVKSA